MLSGVRSNKLRIMAIGASEVTPGNKKYTAEFSWIIYE